MISPTDIHFVLSGGAGNTDPNASLGGDPSSHMIQAGLDNLFNDLSDDQTAAGYTDYRCFYIFNNNASDTFFNTAVWIDSTVTGSGTISLGVELANETQQIVIQGDVTGGSLPVIYEGNTVTWNWNASLSQWATNLEDALNSITSPLLTGVIVSVSSLGNVSTFQITFANQDGNRYEPLVGTGSISSLIGCTAATPSKIQNGSPVNSVATTVEVATTAPFGIEFTQPTYAQPLFIGSLRGTDGFPIWVKRTVAAGSGAVASAGFDLLYKGSPF